MDHTIYGEEVVILGPQEVALLMKEVNGSGGFQSLLKALRRNMRGDVVILTPTLKRRVTRYATKYGGGGFQQRLASVIEAATR